MRLFTAIQLPTDVLDHLQRVQEYLADPSWELRNIKWVVRPNLHLTLKFVGEVTDEKLPALQRALQDAVVQPMSLFADGIGAFPHRRRAHVLTANIGGQNDRVAALFDQIERACESVGVARDRRRFTPHITIGRSRHRVAVHDGQFRNAKLFPGPVFHSTSFQLIKSTLTPGGSVYELVGSYGSGAAEMAK